MRGHPLPHALLVVAIVVVTAACPAPSASPTPDAGVDIDAIAACAPLGSGDLVLAGVEAEPGFDDVVRAVDVATLPPTLPLARASAFERLLIAYLLEGRAMDEANDTVDVAAAAALGPLGLTVVAAIDATGDVDVSTLRRGLHRFYGCSRAFPTTLAGFIADMHDWRADPQQTTPSTVKNLRRRIFRNGAAGVFVAETLNDDDSVRETEIILTDARRDGALDFLEYDAGGILRGASRFAAAGGGQTTGPAPFACIACHGTDVVSPAPP
jgi:hypothetical protein